LILIILFYEPTHPPSGVPMVFLTCRSTRLNLKDLLLDLYVIHGSFLLYGFCVYIICLIYMLMLLFN